MLMSQWNVRRLRRRLRSAPLPRHVGIIMDGNRRWARNRGIATASAGHRAGGEHVEQVLAWCRSLGITHVTVFVCSTENLRKRDPAEVAFLMRLIEEVVADRLARPSQWRIHLAGSLEAVPPSTARALREAVEATRGCTSGQNVTLAIGYGGRQEVVDAFRGLLRRRAAEGRSLRDIAADLTVEDVDEHLYTAGQPEPDLVIRTSGERRMSNFLLWQSAHAELYFCDAYWPAFREVDLLRALCSFADRRRFGGDGDPVVRAGR
jgi:short-chain Z-isoprenyl diphosphate synthase